MTVPLTPGIPAPLPAPTQESLDFPLGWLLDNASSPIQYRATVEVARIPLDDPARFEVLPYTFEPALAIAVQQNPDGIWYGSMLAVPAPRAELFQGIGTIAAVRRLVEYGWTRESPPLVHARRTLFRLLAEDEDPSYLFELAPKGKAEPEVIRHGRGVLREAAAAALAHAGYEADPRLRGAARRLVERVDGFLRSPHAAKPFVRVGNQHVLAPGAFPPSIFFLTMLAHMPHFRSEHYDVMERLNEYLLQPVPRATPATVVGKKVVAEPRLVLGDPLPHRSAADADLPAALYWLEVMARLGLLRRNEGWSKLFDRLLDDRDHHGVWRAPKRGLVTRSTNPFVWPSFPLEARSTPDALSAEVTFRLGLIARLAGRPLELV